MNAKLAKILRQFAKYRMLPYKAVKRTWERSSKKEQVKTLPQIKKVIALGKEAQAKAKSTLLAGDSNNDETGLSKQTGK